MKYEGQTHIVLGPAKYLATCTVCGQRLDYPDGCNTHDDVSRVVNAFLRGHRHTVRPAS